MSSPGFSARLIEGRVFLVVLVFSIVSGLENGFLYYFPVLLQRLGLTYVSISIVNIMFSSLGFLFSPILFFIVLYKVCGGPLLNRIASVIISLVFASLIGQWVGNLVGSIAIGIALGQAGLIYPISALYIPVYVVSESLLGLAVLSLSDLNAKWRNALPMAELQRVRPGGVTLLAAFYVISALVNTLVAPILAVYTSLVDAFSFSGLFLVLFALFFGIIIVGQLTVAFGLYGGRKWGWILALISSASILLMDGFSLALMMLVGGYATAPWLLAASLIGLVINLMIMLYLLSLEARGYFGFVNPNVKAENVPPRPEEPVP